MAPFLVIPRSARSKQQTVRIAEEKHWVAVAVVMLLLAIAPLSIGTNSVIGQAATALPPPVVMTAEEDHQRMLNLLQITSLRPGVNGSNPEAPNAANYDESKANPYPNLPDPLVLKNGNRVTTAKVWWKHRRGEIVEDFDREIYGRVPKVTPKVIWEVSSTTRAANGDVPVITKKLIGHVDNSSYPLIKVDIQLTLSTPANATAPVPVIMEFGFVFPPGFRQSDCVGRGAHGQAIGHKSPAG